MISKTTQQNIRRMMDKKPIPNPCPEMEKIGYRYEYRKGLVDETPYYTRVEEDSIVYTNPRRTIKFNLGSQSVVISETEDNANFYGGKPTLFFHPNLIRCMNDVMEKLGWKE